jgi:hypothetical protein
MTNTTNTTILVIASTGKTGKRVADQLFDWEDPQTWAPALAGVDKVYIAYSPDLAVPGSVDAITGLTERAVATGVIRLVLLAGRGEEEAERAEDVLKASGLEWTIIRPTFYSQNFREGAWPDDRLAGTVALPVGVVGEPFIDADDIADAVADIEGATGRSFSSPRCRRTTVLDGRTPVWPAVCSARSDATRRTSPATPARPPRPVCGRRQLAKPNHQRLRRSRHARRHWFHGGARPETMSTGPPDKPPNAAPGPWAAVHSVPSGCSGRGAATGDVSSRRSAV